MEAILFAAALFKNFTFAFCPIQTIKLALKLGLKMSKIASSRMKKKKKPYRPIKSLID